MRLVVDASTLVAEAFRRRGRELLMSALLDLAMAADTWNETQHELGKRVALLVRRGHLELATAMQLLDEALATIAARVFVVPSEVYAGRMNEAQRRIPRDPRDAPTVALALTLVCGIWTGDHDFFGCGVPVWITETLKWHLDAKVET